MKEIQLYGRTNMTMLNEHNKIYGSLGIREAVKTITKIAKGTGQVVLTEGIKAPFEKFELSGNSKQTSTTGKNLFDISKNPYKCDEEKICIPSKPLGEINITNGITFEEKTAYSLSWESYTITKPNSNWSPIFGVKYTDETNEDFYMHLNKNGFKTNANKTIGYVYIRNPWSVGTEVNRIQIEKGNVATDYEPYTGGKPSPSPEYPQEIVSAGKYDETSVKYLFDVNVIGKNLIDIDALKNENGYMSGAYEKSRDIDHFNIVKGKRYLLITKGKPLVAGDYSSVYFGDETLKYGVNHYDVLGTATGYTSFTSDLKQNRAILTAKKTATITKMILHGKANTRKDDYDVEEFGLFEILEDNTNIDYEPYKEPQTTQIALDEPLRGIGEYKDVITKDSVLRKIKEIVFDGDEVWKKTLYTKQRKNTGVWYCYQ